MPTDPATWALSRRAATSRGEIAWDVVGRVHVFDLLGFGQSERHEQQVVSIRAQGAVLAELVQQWRLEAPALVGHDIGGAAVLWAHLLEGTPARQLALVDAVALRPWITPATRHLQAHLDVYRTMPTSSR